MAIKDLTEIICIIDKSGSMDAIVNDAIGGFNSFLESQKKEQGLATMTIILFDTEYTLLTDALDVKKVRPLTRATYIPGGATALLDAVGKTIDDVGKRLSDTPENERPERIIVAILTDGEENSSHVYSRKQVFEKIKHQTEVYSWQFIFLAANQDAFKNAESIGIDKKFACAIDATPEGIKKSYSVVNEAVNYYRRTGKVQDKWNEK